MSLPVPRVLRRWSLLLAFALAVRVCEGTADEVLVAEEEHDHRTMYVNEWGVEIHGGEERARAVAESLGFKYVSPVSSAACRNALCQIHFSLCLRTCPCVFFVLCPPKLLNKG